MGHFFVTDLRTKLLGAFLIVFVLMATGVFGAFWRAIGSPDPSQFLYGYGYGDQGYGYGYGYWYGYGDYEAGCHGEDPSCPSGGEEPDTTPPTASVMYTPSSLTNTDVVAMLTGMSEPISVTNNWFPWSIYYTFTENWSFTFEFQNASGNTGSATATVTWIDKVSPVITITNPSTSSASSKTITASMNESGTLTMTVWSTSAVCDGSRTYIPYASTSFTSTADNGKYVCYRAEDLAGNITYELSAAIAWIVAPSPGWVPGPSYTVVPEGDTATPPTVVPPVTTPITRDVTRIWSITNSPYPAEWNAAYLYAYGIGMTNKHTIHLADMEWDLYRVDAAQMLVNYAMTVRWMMPDVTKPCVFKNISHLPPHSQWYITLGCQLGIIGVNIADGNFDPYGKLTRMQLVAVLGRILYGNLNESASYYLPYLSKLQNDGIIKTDYPLTATEKRWYLMIMLRRLKNAGM
jgi:hypothetical protein